MTRSIIYHFANVSNFIFPIEKLGTIESIINNKLKYSVQWVRGNNLSLNET